MAGDFPNLSVVTASQWPEPNLINPETRYWFPIISVCLLVFATSVFVVRIWAQIRKSRLGLCLDDLVAFFAWIFSILFTAACLIGTLKFGFDRHIWDVDRALYNRAALIQWLSEASFVISINLTKISVFCFYRRMDPSFTASFRRVIHILMLITAMFLLACILTQALLCRPTSAYWTTTGSIERKCAGQQVYYLVQGSVDVVSTVSAIAVPYIGLRNVSMVKSHRIALRVIIVMSLSVVGAAVARTIFLYRLVYSLVGDATWNGFNIFVSAQLECHLAIIYASIPYFHHLDADGPSLPIVFYTDTYPTKHGSVVSRVSSLLSGKTRQLPRSYIPRERNMSNSSLTQRAMHFDVSKEWELQVMSSPRCTASASPVSPAVDEVEYEQYVKGNFGPPAPPKDSRELFEQYRRERHVGFV